MVTASSGKILVTKALVLTVPHILCLFFTPRPHFLEHSPQGDQRYSSGNWQEWVLQGSCLKSSPTHGRPFPYKGIFWKHIQHMFWNEIFSVLYLLVYFYLWYRHCTRPVTYPDASITNHQSIIFWRLLARCFQFAPWTPTPVLIKGINCNWK